MNYTDIFNRMNPDFFKEERIRCLSEGELYSELVLDLHKATVPAPPAQFPENITFGPFHGDLSVIREAVKD